MSFIVLTFIVLTFIILIYSFKLSEERIFTFKETHREKTPSNKTLALTKSTNMGIWVVVVSNQVFIRGS